MQVARKARRHASAALQLVSCALNGLTRAVRCSFGQQVISQRFYFLFWTKYELYCFDVNVFQGSADCFPCVQFNSVTDQGCLLIQPDIALPNKSLLKFLRLLLEKKRISIALTSMFLNLVITLVILFPISLSQITDTYVLIKSGNQVTP